MDLIAAAMTEFAEEVGATAPVTVVGGRTHWEIGGPPRGRPTELRAPAGVVDVNPPEMTARVRAGTTIAELEAALAPAGQRCRVSGPREATVGGVLSVGQSDVHRLGRGPLRDAVLEVTYVSAEGRVVRGGGPTVKNVSGYDLPRLLVGSLGTLGLLGEVVLRTYPVPERTAWFSTTADPFALRRSLHAPSSILWDGSTTWIALEGSASEVAEMATIHGLAAVSGPPTLPRHRRSVDPSTLVETVAALDGGIAEVGVGVVHADSPAPSRTVPPTLRELHDRLKREFDPSARLNPGRDVLT